MPQSADFFPSIEFAIVYLVTLAAFLFTATYTDLRTTIIPKWLTLSALPMGIVLNIVRTAMLAQSGRGSDYFDAEDWMMGAVSGLTFSILGFLFGFAVFFFLWIMGVSGGGDVKMFAVLGAWIGTRNATWVLGISMAIIGLLILGQTAKMALTGNWQRLRPQGKRFQDRPKPVKRLITFALPLTIATGIWLIYQFRYELQLLPRPTAGATGSGTRNAP